MKEYYKGKKVLVTGGSGSIGSEIVKELLKFDVDTVRILDNNETGLFDLENELKDNRIRTLIGDIRDLDRLKRAFQDIDIIFHAAAYKHVPLCEYNPSDAVKTNVLGTQNVIDAAVYNKVSKVVLISTDKAVNPVNVMGATKLLAERLMISSNVYGVKTGTTFSCVRFGNVLNSRGSVIPLFKKQISKGGPITITDKEMTRFIMDISDAAKLILKSGLKARGGEIFILKMPAVKLTDLSEAMIEYYAPKFGYSAEDIEVKLIGKRVGEKIYEELMTPDEVLYFREDKELLIIDRSLDEKDKDFIYNSMHIEHLNKAEIIAILEKMDK